MLFLKLVILPLRLFLPCLRRIAIFDPAIYDFILSTMSRDAGLSKDELLKLEGSFIRQTSNCINKRLEGLTNNEYYEEHKEGHNKKQKNIMRIIKNK